MAHLVSDTAIGQRHGQAERVVDRPGQLDAWWQPDRASVSWPRSQWACAAQARLCISALMLSLEPGSARPSARLAVW
jgi:hypothetical protein